MTLDEIRAAKKRLSNTGKEIYSDAFNEVSSNENTNDLIQNGNVNSNNVVQDDRVETNSNQNETNERLRPLESDSEMVLESDQSMGVDQSRRISCLISKKDNENIITSSESDQVSSSLNNESKVDESLLLMSDDDDGNADDILENIDDMINMI